MLFGGGGCRCFWQVGFWEAAAQELGLTESLQQVAAVSAGSAMACAVLLGQGRQTLERFKAEAGANPRNAYPANLLRPGVRVFPHTAMYRAAMGRAVDQEGLERLQRGPDIRIVIGRPPPWLGARSGLALGLALYLADRRGGDPLLGGRAARAGFTAEVARVGDCRTPDELIELVLASSCTPPFTPALRRGGRAVIDGSVVQSAPFDALPADPGRTLVLLTRRYGTMPPPSPATVYVQPSQPIAVSKWDYTSPDGIQAAYDMGVRDGEEFLRGA